MLTGSVIDELFALKEKQGFERKAGLKIELEWTPAKFFHSKWPNLIRPIDEAKLKLKQLRYLRLAQFESSNSLS